MNAHDTAVFGATALSEREIEKLSLPTSLAEGLPGRTYYDPSFYELERKHVFAAGWTGIGFASDVPNVGDVVPVSVADYELILVRAKSGEVKCYHNICRHRGMKLVKGKGNVKTIRCSYHCWTYGLEGNLLATPSIAGVNESQAEGFDLSQLSLVEVRIGQYLDVIFANIDGKAKSLDEFLKPVRERLEPIYDFTILKPTPDGTGRGSRDFAVNWKIVVEGGIEDYHLPFVHKAFDHSKDYSSEIGGSVYSGFSSRRSLVDAQKRYATKVADGNELPFFPSMVETGIAQTVILFVFPATIITCTPNYMSLSLQLPRGPELTHYTSKTYFIGDSATSDAFAKLREENTIYWKQVLDEDDGPWRQVQAMARNREEIGLPSRFSPHWEVALHNFQKTVAEKTSSVS
ncbi:aromatic ring-hydroxylating dioxygenase subunit alpha [Rhizobium sp. NPDC090279]|uniref:aromatic ring-hydroxylating oxygenase subunit alpha n=1 Tax=Rhizobium sp. NPDC090279 TaxID=3364499 RepID=UPI00383BCE0F